MFLHWEGILMSRLLVAPLVLLAGLAYALPAHAELVTPTSISYTGTGVEFFTEEIHLIDASGLSDSLLPDGSNIGAVTHGSASADTAWVTDDPNGGPGDYFDPAGAGGTVTFDIDLGGTFSLREFAYWGYGFGAPNGNSISSVRLDFSTDGGTSVDSSQTVAVPLIFGPPAIVPLTRTDANFITMEVLDNYFNVDPDAPSGGDRVGLAEIRFTTVPEPSTLVLAGLLLGLCGLIARRR
jgi:hypothetical protein